MKLDKNGNLIYNNVSLSLDSNGNLQYNPIKKKKKEEDNGWFDAGAFEHDSGLGMLEFPTDVAKTILGTTVDTGASILKGVWDTGQNIAKAGVGAVAQISEWTGNNEYAELLRNRLAGKDEKVNKRLEATDIFGNIQKGVKDSSALGNQTESILSGVGNYAGMAAAQSVGVPWQLTAGLSSAGAGLEEAYKNGATNGEAWTSAAIDAGAEILSENIFGGLKLPGTGKSTEKMIGGLTKKISNKMFKGLTEFGINAAGEGAEEVISGTLSALGKKLTYMKDKELNEIYSNEDKLNDFVAGALSTVIANGVDPRTYHDVKAGRSLITHYTNNEQDLIDNLVDERIQEAEKNEEKYSKKKIEQQVEEDLANGYIDLDNIEKSLGGDYYTKYQDTKTQYDELQSKIDELLDKDTTTERQKRDVEKQLATLEQQQKNLDLEDTRKQLSSYVNDLTQNDALIRNSYDEYFKKGNAYNVDLTKIDEKYRDTYKRAIDSGVLNDTRRSHDFLDLLAKLENEKGVKFDFTNNEKLKDSSFALKDKQVDGFVNGDTITLNMDSNKALNQVVGHEITHILEGTELYQDLQNAVKEYATTKGVYETKLNDLRELYKEVKDANIENELTSDLVGEYLFTDEDFVRRLSTQNRNLFQKIYDEIKYLSKLITSGSKEGRQLEKLKHTFEKAYMNTQTNVSSDTKYSIVGIKSIEKAIKNNQLNAEQKNIFNKIKENYDIALSKKEKMDNEGIRRKYGWFQDKNGDWKFEITDANSDLKIKPKKNETYKLGELLDHKLLYDIDPKLKNLTVKFKDLSGKDGVYYELLPIRHITLNNNLINKGTNAIKSTLLHEIQHYNQYRNNFETGSSSGTSMQDMIDYVNSLGEIESTNVQQRMNLKQKELRNIAPESSKANPKHANESELLQKRINELENKKNNGYNKTKKGRGNFDEEIAQDLQKNQNEDNDIFQRNGIELDNSSFSNTKYSISADTGKMQENGKDVTLNATNVGNKGTLMALHNISEDKLNGVLELNGIPVPSIAITNPEKVEHKGYGDGTLIFDKSTIDPKNKLNEVYDRDVWSPRFPNIAREIIDKNIDKAANNIGISDSSLQSLAEEYNNVENLAYRLSRDTDIVEKFLDDNNIKYTNEDNVRKLAEENGIMNYLNNELKDIYGKKGIYNEKSYLDDNGNRRTFWQMHDEYTLENIVKNLTRKDTKSSETTIMGAGFGNIQANMANKLGSIEDIKQNESKIMSSDMANEELQKIIDEFNVESNELSKLYGDKFDPFWDMDSINYQLQELSKSKNINRETFYDIANTYNPILANADTNLVDNIVESMNKLKSIPTDYFEAKPQRAVGLDEIGVAVIPNTWSSETKQALTDKGVNYIEYDPTVEGDRQRVENMYDEFKFSISNQNEDIAPTGNYKIKGEDIKLQDIAPIETKQEVKETAKPKAETPKKEEIELPFDYEEPLKINELDDKTINKITKNLKSELSLNPYEIKEFKKVLSDISKNDNITKEEISNLLEKNFGEKTLKVRITEIADIKKELKNTKIFVPDYVKIDIPDYSDFRQRNYNKIALSKEGMSIDKVYQELCETHPEYFSKDITNPADQLQEIAYVANLDKYITDTSYLDESKIDSAANWIYDSIEDYNLQQEVKNGTLGYNEYLEKSKQKDMKKTKKIVYDELLDEMGITIPDLEVGKDISSIAFQRTDPIRVNEKVYGYEVGNKINDATIRKTNHNEAEKIRFKNNEREEIKNLGIKARSKESAAVQKYGEKQFINDHGEVLPYGDVELAKEFSDVKIQEKIKKAAKFIRNKYDIYIDRINKVITNMGYNPIPKRPDYMRHFQELTDKLSQWGIPLNPSDMSKDSLPTDINGITDQFKPGKNWFASAMQRKGLKTTYDAITGIDGYLETASDLIYHTEDIQRYRALSKLIRDTYGQTHGMDNIDSSTKEGQQRLNNIMDNKLSKYAAWLDEQANALAGKKGGIDRAAERLLGRKIYTIADTAKKQVGSNMTGFNVRSALTNFASAVQGASKTNKLSFLKGTISTIKNMINNDGLIDKSDFLTNRFGSDTLSKKLWQKASNAGQILMTGSDYFTANQIWRSKYYENMSKGMNETEAIKNADDFASRIMGDRSKGMTAEIFNSKTLGLLTQFQLEVNNQWSSIVHDNKMDIKSGNKSGATVLFQLGQLAAMSYLFNNFMKSLTGSDVMLDPIDMLKELFGGNDDDDEETTLEERSQKVLGSIVNNLPFASFMTGGRIPIAEAFTGVGTAFNKLTGQKDKYGNDITWDDVKDDVISSAAYWLLPTGYGQLKKTVKGMSMYDEKLPLPGSYTNGGNLRFTADNSTGGKIKAALFGEYSSEEAQKYRENYETINKNDVDMLKKLNMDSSEYKKFKNKMDNATETSMKKDGKKYTKYFDANDNTYWYDKETKKLYDDNFRESNKNVLDLKKASNNELLYDYISKLQVNENQKQMLFNKYFTNATTDQYGYEKYKDSKGKTYWYNKDKGILYDSKYNNVIDKSISDLQKVTETKDMKDYKKYGSYEEADFAIRNPDKYLTSRMVTNSYDTYKKYMQNLSNITGDKDVNDKTIPNSKKKKVIQYIDGLNEDYGSKIILYKMYYPSDNSYNAEIVDYLNNSNKINLEEEKQILSYLGMKIKDDGTVRW